MEAVIKKRMVLVLSLLLGWFSIGPASLVYAASGNFILSTTKTTLATGVTFDMPLRVYPGTGINAISADLTYDSSKVEYVSNSDTGTAFPLLFVQTPSTGKFSVTRSTYGANVSGNVLLVTFHFKTIAKGSTSLNVSGRANASGKQINLPGSPLAITIGSTASSGSSAAASPTTSKQTSQKSSTATSGTTEEPTTAEATDSSASGILGSSSILGGSTTSGKKSLVFVVIGVATILILGGGIWFWRHRRKQAQLASSAPIWPTDVPTENSSPAPTPTIPPNLPTVNNSTLPTNLPASQVTPTVIEPQVIRPAPAPSPVVQTPPEASALPTVSTPVPNQPVEKLDEIPPAL